MNEIYFYLIVLTLFIGCEKQRTYSTLSGKIIIDEKIEKKGKITIAKSWWKNRDNRKVIDIGIDGSFKIEFDEADRFDVIFSYPEYQPFKFELDITKHNNFEGNIYLVRPVKASQYTVSYKTLNSSTYKKVDMSLESNTYSATVSLPDTITDVSYFISSPNGKIQLESDFTDEDGYYILNKNVSNGTVRFDFTDKWLPKKEDFGRIENIKHIERLSILSNIHSAFDQYYSRLAKTTKGQTQLIEPFLGFINNEYEKTSNELRMEVATILNTVIGLSRLVDTYNEDFKKATLFGKENFNFASNTRYNYWYLLSLYKEANSDRNILLNKVDSIINNPLSNSAKKVDFHSTKFTLLTTLKKYDMATKLSEELIKNYPNSYFNEILKRKASAFDMIGKSAPDIILKDENGKTVQLSDYKGKYVFLDFWATWCSPCIQEFPHIGKAYDKINSERIEFISICLDAEAEQLQNLKNKYNMHWVTIGKKLI